EILHGLVDLIFLSAAIDWIAIDCSIETGAEGIRAFVDAIQQVFYLLVARPGWPLLRRHDRTGTRERKHRGHSDNRS
ncbi:MAG TPA: hypothetical protein VLK65_19065, partial [Vicinamibacteria bacterium]|nr:hypothetical protein [Vicinamibacteria bacterium]